MKYYGIFYKDKDGFEILAQMNDTMLVFSGQREAQAYIKVFKEEMYNRLNPKIQYKKVRSGFFKTNIEYVPEPIEHVDMWIREPWIQKMNTCFIKTITII